jgi:hypothetical protein
MKARLPLIAALAVTLAPLPAFAQAWVGNPDFSEGVGIRAGNFELHPGIGAEFGYDSNYFRSSAEEGVIDVFKLRITPSITLNTLRGARRNATKPADIVFMAGAHVAYSEVFPAGAEQVAGTNKHAIGFGGDTKLQVFPARKVGFDLSANYLRVVQTDGSSDDLAGEGFNRGTARGGGGVTWRPGGGQFEWRVGYAGTYNYFEGKSFDYLANFQHDFNTRGRWRFLPRSALLFDSNYVLVRYRGNTPQTDGDIVRTRVGFHGLVTYHLSLMGLVGWASSFYRTNGDVSIQARQFDSMIGQAEARWLIQPRPDLDAATIATGLSSIAVGYARSFSNSYQGSFYQRDRGYVQFSAYLLGALVGGLDFGVSRVAFPAARGGITNRNDDGFKQLRLDARAFAEYRLTDTFAVNGTVHYDQVNSDRVAQEDLSYSRWQAFVGVRYFW